MCAYARYVQTAKHPNKRNFLGELNRRIYIYNTLNITTGDDDDDEEKEKNSTFIPTYIHEMNKNIESPAENIFHKVALCKAVAVRVVMASAVVSTLR